MLNEVKKDKENVITDSWISVFYLYGLAWHSSLEGAVNNIYNSC